MGDLTADTAVEQVGDGRWVGRLSDEWNVWGPNGGYVASVCLRAAGAATGLARPATIACHYLTVGRFDEVQLDVDVLRATKRTAAVRVHMRQGDQPVAEATVWATVDDLPGFEWVDVGMPDVRGPSELPTMEERLKDDPEAGQSPFSFARQFDQRPVQWRTEDERAAYDGGAHEARTWMRYLSMPDAIDPWVDASRSLVLLDTWPWAAAATGLRQEERGRYLAPNLDVTARFHQPAAPSDWLLIDARAPIASGGLIGTEAQVWTEDGRLAASGGAQLFCRPGPNA